MLSFLLNLPYSIIGILMSIFSVPINIHLHKKPLSLVVRIKSFWWAHGWMNGTRAATVGHVVLLGPSILEKDLEHELVHVEQHSRLPLIFPFIYFFELLKNGYRENRFEKEAYDNSGNAFLRK